MKEVCKNCANYMPSYKGGVCTDKGNKRVKAQGTCEYWRAKR